MRDVKPFTRSKSKLGDGFADGNLGRAARWPVCRISGAQQHDCHCQTLSSCPFKFLTSKLLPGTVMAGLLM